MLTFNIIPHGISVIMVNVVMHSSGNESSTNRTDGTHVYNNIRNYSHAYYKVGKKNNNSKKNNSS